MASGNDALVEVTFASGARGAMAFACPEHARMAWATELTDDSLLALLRVTTRGTAVLSVETANEVLAVEVPTWVVAVCGERAGMALAVAKCAWMARSTLSVMTVGAPCS